MPKVTSAVEAERTINSTQEKNNIFSSKMQQTSFLHLEKTGLTNKASAKCFTFMLFGETGMAAEQMSAGCQLKTVFGFVKQSIRLSPFILLCTVQL